MRVAISLHHAPVISEVYILNELKELERNRISFIILDLDRGFVGQEHSKPLALGKTKNKFIRVPDLPRNIPLKIIFTVYYLFRTLLYVSLEEYFRMIFWLLSNLSIGKVRYFFKSTRVIREVKEFNPDLFYSHAGSESALLVFFLSRLLCKKFGIIFHSLVPRNIDEYFPYYTQVLSHASFIIVKAKFVKNDLSAKFPFIKNKIYVLPWGIDCNYFKPRFSISKNRDVFTIISITRLAEKKGIPYLIKACHKINKKGIKFRCFIIGDGQERDKLLMLIKKLQLEKFVFLKKSIYHSTKFKRFLSEADLFVLPSIIDSRGDTDILPNAVFEAMAMEIPIITTEITGMDEIIVNGVNGFIIRDKDPEKLFETIYKVIKLPRYQRRKIGKNARISVMKCYKKEKLGKNFVLFLQKLSDKD